MRWLCGICVNQTVRVWKARAIFESRENKNWSYQARKSQHASTDTQSMMSNINVASSQANIHGFVQFFEKILPV